MAVSLSPIFQLDSAQVDANGDPRSGAKLFQYLAGTSTKTTTYKTSSGSGGASHENPIVLDSNGLPPAPIWLTQGLTYKFYLAAAGDTDPPTSPLIPVSDNITGINDVADVVSTEWTPSGMTPTYISGTSFSVTGDQTSILHVNRRLKLTVTGVALYAYIIKSVYTSLTTVTVLVDGGTSLTSGLTAFSYSIVSAANTSLPFLSYDQQCCRLGYVSATQIRLDPQNGKMIWVYTGASGWTRRSVSSSGVTAANTSIYLNGASPSNLGASTFYFVYLFDNSGTLTMDFSTTAPAVDATSGLKIKTGDPTRLLIGMVRTNASSQFQANGIGVLSWYQRCAIQVTGTALTGPPTTTSATFVELQAAAQVKFLSWAEEAIQANFSGNVLTDDIAQTASTCVTLDGVVTTIGAVVASTSYVNGAQDNASCGGYATVTEGYHYATITVKVNSPTATWAVGGVLQVLSQG